MKILIGYPHGLGDCILLTPALRALKARGDYVGVCMLKRFQTARLFDNNPNVDEVVWVDDPWNDFSNAGDGFQQVKAQCSEAASRLKYDKMVFLNHKSADSKITINMNMLSVEGDIHTEVYVTDEDRKMVDGIIPDGPFGFIHGSSPSLPPKDFPPGWAKKWLNKNKGISRFIEVGVDFNATDGTFTINQQFAIMEKASARCLIDSSFYHAAHAMDLSVGLAYFNRGERIYKRVRPLHPVKETIVYDLPNL